MYWGFREKHFGEESKSQKIDRRVGEEKRAEKEACAKDHAEEQCWRSGGQGGQEKIARSSGRQSGAEQTARVRNFDTAARQRTA